MKNNPRFQMLLKKYRSNRLSASEYEEFIALMKKNGVEKNQILEDQARDDWGPSKRLLQQYHLENQKRLIIIKRKRLLGWSTAAAIALFCMAWFLWPQKVTENVVYQTGFGETQNIELPDGSMVLLNANSRLIWEGEWENTEQRHVELNGEAFFDVAKVKNTTFAVVASDVHVNVLGTEFNVRNRNANAEVFLHEGKVDLSLNSDRSNKITMKPGDFVQYDKSDQTISVEEHKQMDKKVAWVDGMLEFENKKVRLILQEFEDLYGKKFKIENQILADKRMDFSLPYADWELVRKALEIAIGAKFTESQDTIIVK